MRTSTASKIVFYISATLAILVIVFSLLSSYGFWALHKDDIDAVKNDLNHLYVILALLAANFIAFILFLYFFYIHHQSVHERISTSMRNYSSHKKTMQKLPDTLVHRSDLREELKIVQRRISEEILSRTNEVVAQMNRVLQENLGNIDRKFIESIKSSESQKSQIESLKQSFTKEINNNQLFSSSTREELENVKKNMDVSIAEMKLKIGQNLHELIRNQIEIVRRVSEGKIRQLIGENSNIERIEERITAIRQIMTTIEETLQEQSGEKLKGDYEDFSSRIESGKRKGIIVAVNVYNENKMLDSIEEEIGADYNSPLDNPGIISKLHPCMSNILNEIFSFVQNELIDIHAEMKKMEMDLLRVLSTFYLGYYERKVSKVHEMKVQNFLIKCDIAPIMMTLNKTLFDPKMHQSEGSRKGPLDIQPLAIVQILEPGFIHPSSQEIICKAKVITNTHG